MKEQFEKPYIWMSSNFKSSILSRVTDETSEACTGLFHTLKEYMYDKDVVSKYEISAVSPQRFAATILPMLEKQQKDEAGDLFTNGYANIFYVKLEDRVVSVRAWWCGGWRLHCYEFDVGGAWTAGSHVFSPAIGSTQDLEFSPSDTLTLHPTNIEIQNAIAILKKTQGYKIYQIKEVEL